MAQATVGYEANGMIAAVVRERGRFPQDRAEPPCGRSASSATELQDA